VVRQRNESSTYSYEFIPERVDRIDALMLSWVAHTTKNYYESYRFAIIYIIIIIIILLMSPLLGHKPSLKIIHKEKGLILLNYKIKLNTKIYTYLCSVYQSKNNMMCHTEVKFLEFFVFVTTFIYTYTSFKIGRVRLDRVCTKHLVRTAIYKHDK
jgi:hypothetical protein